MIGKIVRVIQVSVSLFNIVSQVPCVHALELAIIGNWVPCISMGKATTGQPLQELPV